MSKIRNTEWIQIGYQEDVLRQVKRRIRWIGGRDQSDVELWSWIQNRFWLLGKDFKEIKGY